MSVQYNVRPAVPEDCAHIMAMLRELNVTSGLNPDKVIEITEGDLLADMFGEDAFCACLVVEAKDESAPDPNQSAVVGYALYFTSYSTWMGRMMFLEDIYLKPDHRGKGLGKELISRVAKIGAQKGCKAMQWVVLETNGPARRFYGHLKAVDKTEEGGWRVVVSSGQSFTDLANQD